MPFIQLRKCVLDRELIFTAVICHVGEKTELFSFQIYVKGPTLAIGYLNLPELDAKQFITFPEHGRLYRTRDWGYMLSDGNLEICGRCDSMVKIRGYSIDTQVHSFVYRSYIPAKFQFP
jgi:non-ribosomal peptide synthetase component F